jgi:hypothetical protein
MAVMRLCKLDKVLEFDKMNSKVWLYSLWKEITYQETDWWMTVEGLISIGM